MQNLEKATLLYVVNPEELKQLITDCLKEQIDTLKEQIDTLKKEFAPKEPDSLLTRDETKDLLKISNFCIHNWMNKGILKHYKVGNRTYFKRSEIEEIMLNSNKK